MWGYGPDYGMMGGWGGYGWMGPFGMIIWLVVLVLIVLLAAWLIRAALHPNLHGTRTEPRSRGLETLEERYARGEINREEYLQKRQDLSP